MSRTSSLLATIIVLPLSNSNSSSFSTFKIKSSNYTTDLGYGFRAITGDVVAYSHSNEISNKSLSL